MHFSLFSKLATDSSLSRAQAFSQQTWRKHHYAPDQGTLCSGLTYFWLNEKLCSRSPLSQFEEPSAELLHHLTSMQALSYYPAFPENFNPGERELLLLTKKYGTRNWKEIQQRVADEHQGDYILYDLSRMFCYDSASIVRFTVLPEALSCLTSLPVGSAVIGVLRYLENGQPDGHRIAYYLDRKNQHHFFDPNAGEVIESRDTGFHQWLNTFLIHASYRKLKPSIEDSFLTLYELRNVSSQAQNVLPKRSD
ncbi:virulence surface antigen [Nitrosospira sp. Nl5]|uniref:YopT-type cysteine protease domain-containing protein n=1 Tax=Nitrosospira sp. Nl5 TaxID=200120 RepID=UPI00088F1156|nr:YopT-type cysteine protease domain-containing protein [Nitrosospira sp. Nl5]SCY41492.1 virulence surface antigen [Nitrosospira sp. Nl5]